MLETLLIVVLTALLTVVMLALYIKRTLPGILLDVAKGAGESITERLQETFESPNMQRAMSILGQKSGDVRATKALRNKAANAIMDQMPGINMIMSKIGISPLEGVQLMNDPLFGPMIKGMIDSFMQGEKGGGQFNRGQGGVM